MDKIRNFCIIAHIDHGKSTLADRLLEVTGTVEKRQMQAQFLDSLELERERGITIKMAPVRMKYQDYTLNLIDTPGHSDFGYEVSRALAAVEGAVLLVDASQGIQAQTIANFTAAKEAGLTLIGAINKIDLNPGELENNIKALADLIGDKPYNILRLSGKTGIGVEDLLKTVINKIPSPKNSLKNDSLQSLIFDSLYDDHKGDIAFIRVKNGSVEVGDSVILKATGAKTKVKEVGYFSPQLKPADKLTSGSIGYIATGLKDPELIKIGDTITNELNPAPALSGYKEPNPVVFVAFYPHEGSDYDDLKTALGKLKLTDSALTFEPDRSEVLGRGFKCGFLGRLHFEIVAERLARDNNLDLISTFPSVAYKVTSNNETVIVENPKDFPDSYDSVEEPLVNISIMTHSDYVNAVLSVTRLFHVFSLETKNVGDLIMISLTMPLADLIQDFDDKLKSATGGFASFSYDHAGYQRALVDRLEILVAGGVVPGLTRVIARDELDREGRRMVEKLKDLLPRQQFAQAIQAKARGHIIARETIPALRKDVTGYLYGGDRTRKMKLWKKQQRGKKRLKERGVGQVDITPSVFRELLKK